MAATATEKTVNGNYGAHPNYNNAEVYQQGQALEGPAPVQPNEQNHAASTPQLSSTEIGWYFVEQYYNTMSKEPGRLYVSHPTNQVNFDRLLMYPSYITLRSRNLSRAMKLKRSMLLWARGYVFVPHCSAILTTSN